MDILLAAANFVDKRTNVCDECGAAFHAYRTLERHWETHSESRPFACATCEKAFRRKDALRAHVLIHTGEKAFACAECRKPFRLRYHLVRHTRRVHTGEAQRYPCGVCDRTFADKCGQRKHRNVCSPPQKSKG